MGRRNPEPKGADLRQIAIGIAVFCAAVMVGCAGTPEPAPESPVFEAGSYDYPIDNPLVATVVGTPPEFRAKLPEDYPVEELRLTLFPEREVPEVLWFHERLRVGFAPQDRPAPLIFSIGGTGAGHDSRLMKLLEAVFVASGFHVISIASPTHPNFIVAGAEDPVPGRVRYDARDLYRVMQRAYDRVRDKIEVTDFYLTGYSLGAWHAAFLAHLDESEGAFDFDKVLLLNPPVSLYRSIGILDRMLPDALPGGPADIRRFIDEAFQAFAQVYKESEFVDFDDDFLYRAYAKLEPTDDRLAALIGLAFRLFNNNMVFTADLMNGGGYLVPRGARLVTATSLTPFFKAGAQTGFTDYLNDFFAPHFIAREPGLDRDSLIAEASLETIADYLRATDKIGMLTSADDIILSPSDLAFLEQTFGDRAIILPNGGHMGNLRHRYVVATISNFFRD